MKHNGFEYVDLGLPSGTKWARCNVGADKETDCGLYFSLLVASLKNLYMQIYIKKR